MVSEIQILEHEERFEDTAEDNELWSKVAGLSNNKVGTNPLNENPKNEGFGPNISDKYAQKKQVGTWGLISKYRGNNEQKQNHTDRTLVQNPHDEHTNNENLVKNEEDNGDIHNDKSDDTNAAGGISEPRLVPKTSQDDRPPWVKENRIGCYKKL